jgi:hypothetical protein
MGGAAHAAGVVSSGEAASVAAKHAAPTRDMAPCISIIEDHRVPAPRGFHRARK